MCGRPFNTHSACLSQCDNFVLYAWQTPFTCSAMFIHICRFTTCALFAAILGQVLTTTFVQGQAMAWPMEFGCVPRQPQPPNNHCVTGHICQWCCSFTMLGPDHPGAPTAALVWDLRLRRVVLGGRPDKVHRAGAEAKDIYSICVRKREVQMHWKEGSFSLETLFPSANSSPSLWCHKGMSRIREVTCG